MPPVLPRSLLVRSVSPPLGACCEMDNRPDVRARELVDEFFEKQDEPQYMRNVLSGLSGIMLVSSDTILLPLVPPSFPLSSGDRQ